MAVRNPSEDTSVETSGFTASEIFQAAVEFGSVLIQTYLQWRAPTTLGNACGGVLIVSLLNYGQVRAT
jgi:formate/nitrite transporter FocA (FNT family)